MIEEVGTAKHVVSRREEQHEIENIVQELEGTNIEPQSQTLSEGARKQTSGGILGCRASREAGIARGCGGFHISCGGKGCTESHGRRGLNSAHGGSDPTRGWE